LLNKKIKDDFLAFAAWMRIKCGIEQAILKFKKSDKSAGRLSFGYFSLAEQRKVTGAHTLVPIK